MSKFAGWLVKSVVTAAMVSCVSMVTAWAMVNLYVGQLLERFGVQEAITSVGITDVWDMLLTKQPESGRMPEREAEATTESATKGTGETGMEPAEDALPVMGEAAGQTSGLYFTAEELAERKNELTDEDRMTVFSILISNLPAEEMGTLSALMEDGVNEEEMKEASKILQQYLTEEEYETLVGILLR